MKYKISNPAYISNHYVRILLSRAQNNGLDVLAIAEDLHLPRNEIGLLVGYNGKDRVEPIKVSAFIRAMWRELDDEFLGFTLTPCRIGTFRLFAEQAIHCENIFAVLELVSRFYTTVRHDIELCLSCEADELVLSLDIDNEELDPEHFLIEFILLSLHRFCSWLASRQLKLNSVSTDFSVPAHAVEYQYLFSCKTCFSSGRNSLHFPAYVGDMPVKQNAKSLKLYLAQAPIKILSRPLFSAKYSNEIAQLLSENDSCSGSSLKDLANYFECSERHLRRRLNAEGVSYQMIKNEIRKEKAIDMLADSKLSISEVGLLLGFVEPSGFTRAFKDWTGLTPRSYRNKFLV